MFKLYKASLRKQIILILFVMIYYGLNTLFMGTIAPLPHRMGQSPPCPTTMYDPGDRRCLFW